jgi:hypothetical protein
VIYYVALPFILVEGGLAPGEAVECPHGAAAIRRAHGMAFDRKNAGAVAFSRTGDLNLGEFEDAVILRTSARYPTILPLKVYDTEIRGERNRAGIDRDSRDFARSRVILWRSTL